MPAPDFPSTAESRLAAATDHVSPARIVPLALMRRGDTFSARRIDAAALGVPIDPWLAVDRFHLAAPTFPPHPHAGFSAITYVLPESPGCMRNRDSLGAHLMIRPGALHWTSAGSGILHEEVPACNAPVEGLQIFLNHPAPRQIDPPRVQHLEVEDVPVVALGAGSTARVLMGRLGDRTAPLEGLSPASLIDVTLAPFARFEWPGTDQLASFALVNAGAVQVGPAGTAPAGAAIVPNDDGSLYLAAGDAGARVVLFAGEPLGQPVHWLGSLALASQEAAEAALARYRAGAMGTLAPYHSEG